MIKTGKRGVVGVVPSVVSVHGDGHHSLTAWEPDTYSACSGAEGSFNCFACAKYVAYIIFTIVAEEARLWPERIAVG
jgi:hypothetical protein